MARSPKFTAPAGMEGMALVGMRPCGCVTAALALSGPPGTEDWAYATEKDVREFYADMAKTGRGVQYMDSDEVRSRGFGCKCDAVASSQERE